jgi:hypothetical protein
LLAAGHVALGSRIDVLGGCHGSQDRTGGNRRDPRKSRVLPPTSRGLRDRLARAFPYRWPTRVGSRCPPPPAWRPVPAQRFDRLGSGSFPGRPGFRIPGRSRSCRRRDAERSARSALRSWPRPLVSSGTAGRRAERGSGVERKMLLDELAGAAMSLPAGRYSPGTVPMAAVPRRGNVRGPLGRRARGRPGSRDGLTRSGPPGAQRSD